MPRDVASRAAKERCDAGFGVNETGLAVFLDFSTAINRLGEQTIRERYGNLFQMYEKITDVNPYKEPMTIYPAVHYTMGGIWVDYNLMTTIPGLYAIGEANFSDHGANRLGASALMQGLADGYFVLPYTIGDYLSHEIQTPKIKTDLPEFEVAEKGVREKIAKLLSIQGKETVDDLHKKLGHIMWENVGMARSKESLEKAIVEIQALRKSFWANVRVPGTDKEFNQELEKAVRLADFLELGELMARDALNRNDPAAVTSAWSTRPRKAKRCATTNTTYTWLHGNIPARTRNRTGQRTAGIRNRASGPAQLQGLIESNR